MTDAAEQMLIEAFDAVVIDVIETINLPITGIETIPDATKARPEPDLGRSPTSPSTPPETKGGSGG